MNERTITTEFSHKNRIYGCFEIKFTSKKSIPFNALAKHQEQALLDISSTRGLYHKITDQPVFTGSRVRFTRQKPFDAFFLVCQPAYVVVCFHVPRKKKRLYYIRIQDWIEMRENATRKSLTEQMAIEYSEIIEDYIKK